MIGLFLGKRFGRNFKIVCLLLACFVLAGCNPLESGGGGDNGGDPPPPTVVDCTGTEPNHPNNPGCIPDGVPYKGLTGSDHLPVVSTADWGNTGTVFDSSIDVPNHSGSISLLALPTSIGRGRLSFNIVGDKDDLYLVTKTTQDAGLSFNLLFVKKDKVEGKYWGITLSDVSYDQLGRETSYGHIAVSGNWVWEFNPDDMKNIASGTDAYTSLGNEGEYFIYMTITRYDSDAYDNMILGKNVIKIK